MHVDDVVIEKLRNYSQYELLLVPVGRRNVSVTIDSSLRLAPVSSGGLIGWLVSCHVLEAWECGRHFFLAQILVLY